MRLAQQIVPATPGHRSSVYNRSVSKQNPGRVRLDGWNDAVSMIDPEDFAQRQRELTAEFARFVLDHPDVDDVLPEDAYVYFQVDGQSEFNEYSRQLL